MDHPFETLLIKDGQLLQRVTTNNVTNEAYFVPYMTAKEVEVQDKVAAHPAEQPVDYWRYLFRLNTNPDPTWEELFYKAIRLNRDAAPNFASDSMTLTCDPANLKSLYQDIKTAIEKANAAHKAEREKVFMRVEREIVERGLEVKRKAEEEERITQEFNDLKL